jgi:hypothetical protein
LGAHPLSSSLRLELEHSYGRKSESMEVGPDPRRPTGKSSTSSHLRTFGRCP